MVRTTATAALQRFVDDELMRAPLLVDQVAEAVMDNIRKSLPGLMPHDRAVASDLLQSVLANRQHIVDYYIRSLRDQVAADLARGGVAGVAAAPKKALSLSLVDEEEVSVDVQISHAIEAIRSVAEYELRELQTFVSALVGDMDVTRDHNPFRPETHARALWAAAQALPLARGYHLSFMRHGSMALAQVLRKAFAGASSRLESLGIEPASHRTLILPSGSRGAHKRSPEASFSPDLGRIREALPAAVADAPPEQVRRSLDEVLRQIDHALHRLSTGFDPRLQVQMRENHRRQMVDTAASNEDRQQIDLLSRIFDAIVADDTLDTDVQRLLSRLQSPFIRLALREPKTMDRDTHPAWRFVDRIAHLGEVLPEPGDPLRERTMRFIQGLIDHVVAEPEQNAGLCQWAVDRLAQHEQQAFEQRCRTTAPEIAALQQLEDRLVTSQAPSSSLHGALDLQHMDTVPAALIDGSSHHKPEATASATWLRERRPSEWVRLFIQGDWAHAQLLWPGERGEVWLFGASASETTWAIRRRALLTMHGENLLSLVEPRSLLRDAAKRVMRRMARAA
ncbi:MAG: DUF1631 family protein [Rubrivivax sp.]